MKKNYEEEEIENKINYLGVNLSIIKSVLKFIDNGIDDEINYSKEDISNLVSVLIRLVDDSVEKYDNIEQLMNS